MPGQGSPPQNVRRTDLLHDERFVRSRLHHCGSVDEDSVAEDRGKLTLVRSIQPYYANTQTERNNNQKPQLGSGFWRPSEYNFQYHLGTEEYGHFLTHNRWRRIPQVNSTWMVYIRQRDRRPKESARRVAHQRRLRCCNHDLEGMF